MTPDDWEIILGPPGTGKTTTLMELVASELETGTPPDRIAYISFTRRATEEAQTRAAARLKLSKRDLPYFRTIHSFCMRAMGISSSQIMEGTRVREFSDYVGERITGRFALEDGSWSGYERGDRMMFMDNLARIRMMPLRQLYETDHDDLDWRVVERFSAALSAFKNARDLVDYTDMLLLFVARGTAPPIELLVVDEAPDLSRAQWGVVELLAKNARRVVIAGDDDQAIYSWAGGATDYFLSMTGRKRVLGQSYRVPRRVQAVADEVIKRVRNRYAKPWAPRDDEGVVRRVAAIEQLDWSGDSTLVLARNRYQLDQIAGELWASGVLYENQGHTSVRPSLLSAIVTWERLRRGQPQLAMDVAKSYEFMTTGVGVARGHKRLPAFQENQPVSMEELREKGGLLTTEVWHRSMDRIPPEERSYLIRCRRNKELLTKPPRVRLSTIHGSKGGEADRVVLLTDLAQRTHQEYLAMPDDECRVFYVGLTRARQEVCVVAPRSRLSFPV